MKNGLIVNLNVNSTVSYGHWPPNSLPKSLLILFRLVECGSHQPNETLKYLSRLTMPSVSCSSTECGCPRNPGIARAQSPREGRMAFGSPLLSTLFRSRSLFHKCKILHPKTPKRKIYTFPLIFAKILAVKRAFDSGYSL